MESARKDLSNATNYCRVSQFQPFRNESWKNIVKGKKVIKEAYSCAKTLQTWLVLLENAKLYEVWKLLKEIFPTRKTRVLQLQPLRNGTWKKVENYGKSYKKINGVYACTKILIYISAQKSINYMRYETCWKRSFKCDQPELCSFNRAGKRPKMQ